jgi:MFS family permease
LIMNFFCPLIGILSDRSGKRGNIVVFAISCLMASHIIISMLPTCPPTKNEACRETSITYLMVPQFLFLIGYSTFVANIWAMLRLIQHKSTRAMALGVSNSVQNGSYFLSNLLVAGVLDAGARSSDSYIQVSQLMALLNAASIVTQVAWGCSREGHKLN